MEKLDVFWQQSGCTILNGLGRCVIYEAGGTPGLHGASAVLPSSCLLLGSMNAVQWLRYLQEQREIGFVCFCNLPAARSTAYILVKTEAFKIFTMVGKEKKKKQHVVFMALP